MSNYFEAIPQAVATIVAACSGTIVAQHEKADEREARIIAFTDKLTRTLAQALIEKQGGK